MIPHALQWLAVALMGVALAAALGAIMARSLTALCMHLMAAGAAIAALALLLGAGEGAVAVALIAAAWAPVLLLAAMLLSARIVKAGRVIGMLPGALAAAAAALATWWPLAELDGRTVAGGGLAQSPAFWIAPLMLACTITVVAMVGYGERGAFRRGDAR